MTDRRNRLAILLRAAMLFSLAGCAGGDEDAPAGSLERIRELTGLSAPAETQAAQLERASGIFGRSDSLILTTMHGETGNPELPAFRLVTQCSGTQCTVTEPLTNTVDTIDLIDVPLRQGIPEALGTGHGVTLIGETSTDTGADLASLGAWLEHSAFAIQNERQTIEGATSDVWYGIALGDLAGTSPAGSATWLGVMVGTPVAGESRGDRLVGDAVLTYALSVEGGGSSLDAAFGGIRNIDRGTAHTVEAVLFENVGVGTGGTFASGVAGSRIQGGFYGPGHAEAAGIFEQQGIVGAFGAKRPQ